MTDLRLLGLTFKGLTITEVVTSLRPWKRLGGVIMITMGLLLATSEAVKYAPNPYFWTKMTLLSLDRRSRPGVPADRVQQNRRTGPLPGDSNAEPRQPVPLPGSVDRHVHHGTAHCLL